MRSEEGLALVAVLIMLIALSALAVGGFAVTTSEVRVSDYHESGAQAFQMVDAAMNEHMGRVRRGNDTVGYTYNASSASVTGAPLLDIGDGNTLHLIEASGAAPAPLGGTANRTLRAVAMMNDNQFRANAAITAGAGFSKNGTSGTIDGFDAGTLAQCSAGPQPDVAGVATGQSPEGYSQNGGGGGKGKGGGGGGSVVPTGNPAIDSTKTALGQLQDLGIPWQGILGGSVLEPDYIDTWPNVGSLDPDHWPVILLTSAAPAAGPGQSGRGTIVASHDLVMNGSFSWQGIVLVGGQLTSNGNNTVEGTTVVGLNRLLGQSVPATSIGNGNKIFEYNSCYVRFAAQQFLGGLVMMPGTWAEDM